MPYIPRFCWASFYNCFHIFFPATVALIWVNSALVVLAITFCQGGLAGSGRTVEDDGGQLVSFDSLYNKVFFPMMCCCPTTSSRVVGRSLDARGIPGPGFLIWRIQINP